MEYSRLNANEYAKSEESEGEGFLISWVCLGILPYVALTATRC